MRRPEHRQGTFAQVYEEMMHIHERMADNGIQFASSLYQMQEDLLELTANAERSRKVWKTNGLTAEQKVVDLEQAMRKSKAKYDSLAEEYDRARTGESRQGGGGKVLGAFKAHKSAAQQEEDLLRKVQGADQIYHGHVTSLQNEKSILQTATRPEVVRALQESVVEIDSGVTLQMQKFGRFVVVMVAILTPIPIYLRLMDCSFIQRETAFGQWSYYQPLQEPFKRQHPATSESATGCFVYRQ